MLQKRFAHREFHLPISFFLLLVAFRWSSTQFRETVIFFFLLSSVSLIWLKNQNSIFSGALLLTDYTGRVKCIWISDKAIAIHCSRVCVYVPVLFSLLCVFHWMCHRVFFPLNASLSFVGAKVKWFAFLVVVFFLANSIFFLPSDD